jgi:hypothetical protein
MDKVLGSIMTTTSWRLVLDTLRPYDVTCNGDLFVNKSTADRVKRHRDALRAAGLRPIQIWVPDTRQRGFAKECKRQSRKLLNDPDEAAILRWLGQAASTEGWK